MTISSSLIPKTSIDRTDPVTDYATKVVIGKIVAGKLVRAACQRHLDDLELGNDRGLVWRPDLARHHIKFFSYLRHSKGEFSGDTFHLEPWQQFRVGSVFGWLRSDGMVGSS